MAFTLFSNQFGYPMWVSIDGTVTDKRDDAQLFDSSFDNMKLKEAYWTEHAGYKFEAKGVTQ